MHVTRVLVAIMVLAGAIGAQDGLKGAKAPGKVEVDLFNDRAKKPAKRGGIVSQAMSANLRALEPTQDSSAITSEVTHGYVLEDLVDGDEETWESRPKLAERWDVEDNLELTDGKVIRGKVTESSDGYEIKDLQGKVIATPNKSDVKEVRYQTSFTFHLRKGVKFHNGADFTAKDVEFTWKYLKDPRNGAPSIQGYFDKVKECTVIDDHTVRMSYSEQYWMALTVCGGYLYVRPRSYWDPEGLIDKDPDTFFKRLKDSPILQHPIGTGPYKFDRYQKDVEVVLSRFDGYWDKTRAQNPDQIKFKIIKDPIAQLQAVKNGEVDYITQVPPEQFDKYFEDEAARRNFAAVTMVYPSYGYFGFNLRRDLFKDKKVRWALAHAVADQDQFIKEVLKGRAERVVGDYYKYSDSYNKDLKPVPFDLKKAEELLTEAGWFDSDGDGLLDKDGRKFEFELLSREIPPTMPVIQHLLLTQANLKKLGIRMNIRKLDWTAFLEKVEKGEFDICRLGWALASPPNQQDLYQIWHSTQIGEAGSNHVSYSNPEVDRLLVAIRRELDPKKRNSMCWEVSRILYEDHPYIWTWMPAEHRIYHKKWQGVRFWVPRPCHYLGEWYLAE